MAFNEKEKTAEEDLRVCTHTCTFKVGISGESVHLHDR